MPRATNSFSFTPSGPLSLTAFDKRAKALRGFGHQSVQRAQFLAHPGDLVGVVCIRHRGPPTLVPHRTDRAAPALTWESSPQPNRAGASGGDKRRPPAQARDPRSGPPPAGWLRRRSGTRSRPGPPARRTTAPARPARSPAPGPAQRSAGPPSWPEAASPVPSPSPHSAPAPRPAPCHRPRRRAAPSGLPRRARRSAPPRRAWRTSPRPAPNIIGHLLTSCPPGAGIRAIDRR